MSARNATLSDRISRISAALGCVTRAKGMDLGGDPADHYHNAACLLNRATPDILRGMKLPDAVAFIALDMATSYGLPAHEYEALVIDVIEALAGHWMTFDGLARDRKINVLRHAMAVIGIHTEGRHGWGPTAAVIGSEAWALVSQTREVVRSYAA